MCLYFFFLSLPPPLILQSSFWRDPFHMCTESISRHLFCHHFPFSSRRWTPSPWYGYWAIYFTSTRPSGTADLCSQPIYINTQEFFTRSSIFLSHIVAGVRLWEIHNRLANIDIYIYIYGRPRIATDIFFFSLSLFSLFLFIIISAKQALAAFDRQKWWMDFRLWFIIPRSGWRWRLCVCVCLTQRPMRDPLISRRYIIGLMQKEKRKSRTE